MEKKKKVKVYKKIKPNTSEKRLVSMKDIKKEKRARKIGALINLALIFVLPIILIFFATLVQKETAEAACLWMQENPGLCLINYVFIVSIYFFWQLLFNKPTISAFLTQFIYVILPIASKLKFDIRGEVVLLSDIALVGNVGNLLDFVEFSQQFATQIILIALFIVMSTNLLFVKQVKTSRKTTAVFLTLFLATLFILVFIPATSRGILSNFGVNYGIRFSPNVVHEQEGTWLGLYSNFVMNNVSEPSNYSKESIFAILDEANKKYNSNTNIVYDAFGDAIREDHSNDVKPNVIMIMSESFFDPLEIPNVEFSDDPIPNVRNFLKNCESGTFISSTFGGGTATIEFEAFTGETAEFLPYGIVPYTDLTSNLSNLETIQKVFLQNGYHTIAMHNYDGSFYNRKQAYEKLNFEEFLESKDLEEVAYYGKYISDGTLVDNIKAQIEKERDDDKPLFIWALTMQNHTPYQTSNYTEGFDKIKIKKSNLTPSSEDKLMAYVNGIYESDYQLKRLIDYLEESGKPTVVMFYGDHLPSLIDVYLETKMISTKETSKWSLKDLYTMHKVPYFIYDNYLNKETKHNNITGATFLGNKLLNYIGIKKSSYFKFLDTLNYCALRDRLFVDAEGKIYDEITKECKRYAEEHRMLEYDMMYGNNYVCQYENSQKLTDD